VVRSSLKKLTCGAIAETKGKSLKKCNKIEIFTLLESFSAKGTILLDFYKEKIPT
jgi:hypothetical protein